MGTGWGVLKVEMGHLEIHFDEYKIIAFSHYVYRKHECMCVCVCVFSRWTKDKNIKIQNHKSAKRKYKINLCNLGGSEGLPKQE